MTFSITCQVYRACFGVCRVSVFSLPVFRPEGFKEYMPEQELQTGGSKTDLITVMTQVFASQFKIGLSPSKKLCVNCLIKSPLNMMKNAFISS